MGGERGSCSSYEQAEAPKQDFIASASKDHFKLKGNGASDRKIASLAGKTNRRDRCQIRTVIMSHRSHIRRGHLSQPSL